MSLNRELIDVDVLVAGGGFGGTAAALAAAQGGCRVAVVEPNEWIGGQITAQGVSCLDEHGYIEKSGGTRLYYELRERIRQYYRDNYKLSPEALASKYLNPGGGWVSALCFEPRVGLAVIQRMLAPFTDTGQVVVYTCTVVEQVERNSGRLGRIVLRNVRTRETTLVQARIVLDATELGDLLPLAKIPYSTGMESFAQTGEPSAPSFGDREVVQSFTYSFAVEFCPGENHTIAKPEGYEKNRARYSFGGYKMFGTDTPFGQSFWTYRRIIAAENFADERYPHDIALINWHSNDYDGGNIIDVDPEAAARRHREAKLLSLGFLYWLQTEAPRDDGGVGYPELKLRPDILGTDDGLAQFPYIRESRRLKAMVQVREEDVVVRYNPGPRARLWPDSVGIGLYYYIDVHSCCNSKLRQGSGQRVRPFQIPLRSMLTADAPNFIAAAKNIGTTHITNGTFRLHPVEWNIGESAGALAAYAAAHNFDPAAVALDARHLRRYQLALVQRGVPLIWFTDLHPNDEAFAAANYLGVLRIIDDPELEFRAEAVIDEATAKRWSANAKCDVPFDQSTTRKEYAQRLFAALLAKESEG